MIAEYAAIYGGPPDPELPWPLFVALLRRVQMFEARARLRLMDAVTAGIAAAFGNDESGAVHRELESLAYPGGAARGAGVWQKNLAAEPADG